MRFKCYFNLKRVCVSIEIITILSKIFSFNVSGILTEPKSLTTDPWLWDRSRPTTATWSLTWTSLRPGQSSEESTTASQPQRSGRCRTPESWTSSERRSSGKWIRWKSSPESRWRSLVRSPDIRFQESFGREVILTKTDNKPWLVIKHGSLIDLKILDLITFS